jgi:hypothetical protein
MLRSADGWFTSRDIYAVFDGLRVPRPGGLPTVLGRLAARGLVIQRRGHPGQWSLTPIGRERVPEIVGTIDLAAVEAEIAASPSADLSDARHAVIPPEFAPPRWQPAIARLLQQFPFEQNVFCMTRFPKDEREDQLPDPVRGVIESARVVLGEFGLTLHLASDRHAEDELFGNVGAHMWVCRYGIGLFETRFGEELNDNVQIEVGGMLITGRRCALLKDRDTPDLPTDFVGHIYKSVDFDDLVAVEDVVRRWARDDLNLSA